MFSYNNNNVFVFNEQLLMAASKGDLDGIAEALANGADINYAPREITPLQLAVSNQKKEMVQYLLDNGANSNVKNRRGWTPFHEVARLGFSDLIEPFLNDSLFVSLNAKDENGDTPLRAAVDTQKEEFIVKLIELTQNSESNMRTLFINSVDYDGISPLAAAVKNDSFNIAKILIEAGAKPEHSERNAMSAIDMAAGKDHFLFLFGQETKAEAEKVAIQEELNKNAKLGVSAITKKKRPS